MAFWHCHENKSCWNLNVEWFWCKKSMFGRFDDFGQGVRSDPPPALNRLKCRPPRIGLMNYRFLYRSYIFGIKYQCTTKGFECAPKYHKSIKYIKDNAITILVSNSWTESSALWHFLIVYRYQYAILFWSHQLQLYLICKLSALPIPPKI